VSDRISQSRVAISAVVITAGRSRHLTATLESLRWCDEVLVLASHGLDAIRRMPAAAACRIEAHPFDGYGPQKRRAVGLASHDWVLSLDDDEWVDDTAVAAILDCDLNNGPASYALRRRTFVGDQEIRHGPWGQEKVVRLFDRRRCEIANLAVHEAVRSPAAPAVLAGSILHHSFENCGEVLSRSIHYARPKAGIIASKQEPVHNWMLPLRAATAFLKSYVVQAGYRDGAAGFSIALSRIIDSTLPRMLVLSERAGGNSVGGSREDGDPEGEAAVRLTRSAAAQSPPPCQAEAEPQG
jgi:hypothetical protein